MEYKEPAESSIQSDDTKILKGHYPAFDKTVRQALQKPKQPAELTKAADWKTLACSDCSIVRTFE
jgi:hypothetical protein